MTERIETVQNITAAELQAGGFAFQLPDGTSPDEHKAFEELVAQAKEKNLNLVLQPNVKVIDLKALPKTEQPVSTTPVEVKTEPKVETPVAETPNPAPVQTEALPQATQQTTTAQPVPTNGFVMPQNYFQPAQQAYVYNPFVNGYGYPMPVAPTQPPVMPQAPLGFHVVMPQYIQPAQEKPKTEEKKE